MTPETASVEVGKTVALTATVTPSNATDKTVTFKSADETLATVDNKGVVTGVKATEPDTPVDIVVTTNDGNHSGTCVVTVRESLDKNLADPTKTFPIKTNSNQIYIGDMKEPFTIGETYTLTIKATKPATQAFRVYNYGMVKYGDMIPVEGLTDVWQLTFTVSEIYEPYPSSLTIYQQPKETVGACQIDWLKIEKGGKITSNINYSNAR